MANVRLGPLSAAPGKLETGIVPVVPGPASTISMPVAIINSGKPGPCLCIIAGIHGSDYPGIEAASRIIRQTHAETIRGTLVVFPLVNVAGFESSEPFLMPVDRQNINRVFPGSQDGTPSYQIAHFLFETIKSFADAVIDLHGGDTTEHLEPFTLYFETGTDSVDSKSAEMARLYDTGYIWAMKPPYGHHGTSIAELAKAGIPAIAGEAGYLGTCHERDVDLHLRGITNIMKHMEMLDGLPQQPSESQRMFRRDFTITVRRGGIFEPTVSPRAAIDRDQLLGRVRNLEGDTLEEIRSPANGVIRTLFPKRVVHAGSIVYRGWIKETG